MLCHFNARLRIKDRHVDQSELRMRLLIPRPGRTPYCGPYEVWQYPNTPDHYEGNANSLSPEFCAGMVEVNNVAGHGLIQTPSYTPGSSVGRPRLMPLPSPAGFAPPNNPNAAPSGPNRPMVGGVNGLKAGLGGSSGIVGSGRHINAVQIPKRTYNDTATFGVSFDYPDHVSASWASQAPRNAGPVYSRANLASQGQGAPTRSAQYVHVAFGDVTEEPDGYYHQKITEWGVCPWVDLNTPYLTYGRGWHRVFRTFVFHVALDEYTSPPPPLILPPGVNPPQPPSGPSNPFGSGGDPFGGDDY